MFSYNPDTNALEEIEVTTFIDNGIKEREHIEEWVRKKPEILSEDLLIIANEYDKFETDERIDLLAIDKDGSLVIIELKRDYTGSQVDFQSLKYCSYCSHLSAVEILNIYKEYLLKHSIQENAFENIANHLGLDIENEDKINEILNNSQKFIIAGREIDKRILSVCAWLTENGINCKCITIKPYKRENEKILYIDIDQIIPPYNISNYYLGAKERRFDTTKIYQNNDIIGFFESIKREMVGKIKQNVNYSPHKSYCVVSGGNGILYALVYQKRLNSFSIEATVKESKYKSRLEGIFVNNKKEIEDSIKCTIELKPEGVRNPDWSRIIVNIGNERKTDIINLSPQIALLYSNFIINISKYWK